MEQVQEDVDGNTTSGGAQWWWGRSLFWQRRGFGSWRREGAPLEESFTIDQTYANTLELNILPHKTSIDIEGHVSAICRLPSTPPWWAPCNNPHRWQCGSVCSELLLDHDPLPILIVLQSCVPTGRDELPCIHEEYWQSYEHLEKCMEPIKQLSILLESSMEATIHDMLDYFLRLLYDKLERGPKRHVGSCTVFNTFVNTFRRKLLRLLDDVEQFFLWVVVVALDDRKTNLDWLALVWDHRDEWPNVTDKYKNVCQLQFEVERNLAKQVRHNLLLCFSVPLECSPQAATVASSIACKFCTGRARDLVHPLLSMKVTTATTQQGSLREKNGGNQPCSSLRLWCHGRYAIVDRWRMSVKHW